MAAPNPSRSAKKLLRQETRKRLSALPEKAILSQSRKAQDLILALPQYKAAKRIAIYLSMPTGEAQTDSLLGDALWNEKSVYVPYLYSAGEKGKVMDMLRLDGFEEYAGLERDKWGIPSLPSQKHNERRNAMGGKGLSIGEDGEEVESLGKDGEGLDMIVVPGVAFDGEMNRIGHGAGFYDRFLTRYCKDERRKKPFLVGLCLAEQILPHGQLVMEKWDWKVDAVAVGDGKLLTLKDT